MLIWLVAVATLRATRGINSYSTDDAMRLVEVRDFMAGQSWFDLTQYRLDPPNGVVTHWSRLIDLPQETGSALLAMTIEAAGRWSGRLTIPSDTPLPFMTADAAPTLCTDAPTPHAFCFMRRAFLLT